MKEGDIVEVPNTGVKLKKIRSGRYRIVDSGEIDSRYVSVSMMHGPKVLYTSSRFMEIDRIDDAVKSILEAKRIVIEIEDLLRRLG